MYSYENITAVHLEVTSKCQAKCPMCPRRIQGGKLMPFMTIDDITYNQFKTWFQDDFIRQLKHLSFCGNLGDPIMSDHTLSIINHLRSLNPTMSIQMNTNGSARNTQWWMDLASLNVKVVFGIDGLEDTHHLYRIDTSFKQIIKNAKIFIANGGDARWDMLVFAHNEHQVDDCHNLSKELGFSGFSVKHTSRFKDKWLDVLDDNGVPIYQLFPTSKSENMISKVKQSEEEQLPTITCKAKVDNQIYISATGNVSPCCWIDLDWYPHNHESRIDYMRKIGQFPNLHTQSLKEIFESNYFESISNTWTTVGLKQCSRQCGSFDKLNEQFTCKST